MLWLCDVWMVQRVVCACVCVCVSVCACVVLRALAQLCCSVLDSMGGAESYRVSVSCVGSPASVQGFDNVPAPQSQKNLEAPGRGGGVRRGECTSLVIGTVANRNQEILKHNKNGNWSK